MSRGAGLLSLVVVLATLVGCTEAPSVGARQQPSASSEPSVARLSAGETKALAAQKKAAGIAECPESDPDVSPVAGGLPDLVLSCLGGGRDVRLAGLRDRPMMINVWAQWCAPCRAEAPFLAEVAAESPGDLMILGVDFVDPQPDLAIEFSQLSGWRYPQLADPDKQLAAPLQVTAPPQTLFVRADGTVAHRHVGAFRSADQIRDLLQQHLGVAR
jgi:thiol-disulfide isomerase/thioredoxin